MKIIKISTVAGGHQTNQRIPSSVDENTAVGIFKRQEANLGEDRLMIEPTDSGFRILFTELYLRKVK